MTLVIICLIPLSILGSTINTKATKTWYDSAQIRIDSIRKGNFTFKVVDKNGVAMQDSVKIKHIKHEFPFGVAYDFSSNGSYGNTFTAQGSIIC